MPHPPDPADQLAHARALATHDPQAACHALAALVSAHPDHARARHDLAMLLVQLGQPRQALPHLRRAVELLPGSLPLLNNLGALLEQLQETSEAIACHRQVTALAPAMAVPHLNLGESLRAAGRLDEATAALRIAATLDPELAEAWAALGSCLLAAGQAQSALGALRRTVALRPDHGRAWRELGDALQSQREFAAAIPCYQRAARLGPDEPEVWYGLGRAQAACGENAVAAAAFARCTALDPRHAAALHEYGKACFELGCVERAMVLLREALAIGNDEVRRRALENLAILVPGSPHDDPHSILATRQAYARTRPERPRPWPPRGPRSGPLRVGYLSSFFDQAHWMKPVWALLRAHDRARVQVHLFVDGPLDKLLRSYQPDAGDHVHEIGGTTNAEAAQRIAAQDLDLLVDLNGYSAPARLPLYLLRPARVQVGWFNLYATSGMDCFDALIGDPHVVKPGEEAHYTERILRVPHSCLTFQVDHATPEVVPAPWQASGRFTFGSLASLYKLTDATLGCWATILARCPGTRLLLRNSGLGPVGHQEHLAARFAAAGIGRDRLVLEGPAPHLEFLATYGRIDVALDPFPYGGGTTTMEALWQGVPVVSLDGDRWASRTSVSLLRAAGLDPFVASSPADYVVRCIAFAHSPELLGPLRAGLRGGLRHSPVCDAAAFARAMEQLYAQLL